MGDVGDSFNAVRDERKRLRAKYGINCPVCTVKLPKAYPSILLPQQKCKVCKYRDPRPRIADDLLDFKRQK